MKYKINFLIALIAISILLTSVAFAMSSSSSLTRSVPTTATTSSSVSVTYATSETGTWGASIEETLTGGCTFPSGSTTYKTVLLSDDGASQIKSNMIKTPSSSATCILSGNYMFGSYAIKNFPDATIAVSGACTSNCGGTCTSSWSCGTCVSGTRTCVDLNACAVQRTETCTVTTPTTSFLDTLKDLWAKYPLYIVGIGLVFLFLLLRRK